ncbi:MAG: tripartite tricarboxylate transporter substrate binding protein [Burkholderiales bacterium]|nr:tripartite tricarboxylate transporter substrate binding protein [Burkholderiales bacterium]
MNATRAMHFLLIGLAPALPAAAQGYPAKPIRMVVPFTPGGPTDILGRLAGQKLAESWGQPVVIDNRTGASGMIGTDAVAKSPADGYTVLVSASVHVIAPSLFPKISYDAIRDFSPVTVLASSPLVLVVTPTLPVRNVKEFIALAKARPGELSFASSGAGSSTHLTAELLKSVTGTKMTHVPYKGQSQALTDVISGQVPFMFNSLPPIMGFVKANRLRVLAITSGKRSEQLPAVPTFAETGYRDLVTGSWYAVWLPAKTPEAIVSRLNAELVRIVGAPDVRQRIIQLGADPVANTPAEFDAYQKAEMTRWAKVIRDSGAKVE